MNLLLLRDTFAICRLAADMKVPGWAQGEFVSVTRTNDELSIVCSEDHIPGEIHRVAGWRCLQVDGKLNFNMVGVIASLTKELAEAEVSVFVISTFDTDFLLVKESDLEAAIARLENAGHQVAQGDS